MQDERILVASCDFNLLFTKWRLFYLHALNMKHALQLRLLLIPRRELLMFSFRANGSLEMTNNWPIHVHGDVKQPQAFFCWS